MDFFCPPTINVSLDNHLEVTNSSFYSTSNDSIKAVLENATNTVSGKNHVEYEENSWDYTDFTRKVAVPMLCTFGIVGNVLNIIILSVRIREGNLPELFTTRFHFVSFS